MFSFKDRANSFVHAGRGICLFIKTTHNAWIQLIIFVIAIIFGAFIRISTTEWMMLVFAGGLVFVTEAINTAIEIHMNLTSPDEHPFARDTKDIAAGAVLIAAITAVVIGLIIFVPHIL